MTPLTNNALESLHGRIKQHYTMRNKLPLDAFMSIAERMLGDWSIPVQQHPFQTHVTLGDEIDSKAYEWLQKVKFEDVVLAAMRKSENRNQKKQVMQQQRK
ncbi:unnamed protein product [Didymodactylos carnosus]|uniref:Uncharacterized protein n=1 Tax=Didymodactylos carnosus TaxID=1234261 RepID=A0A8S2J155_9BILA|nr:unnamed protein product [Didymodactylos carnosus]CAF3773958.1 unnamed protein product [Didymodactylos carnosus]